jgi:hypothetical protein
MGEGRREFIAEQITTFQQTKSEKDVRLAQRERV